MREIKFRCYSKLFGKVYDVLDVDLQNKLITYEDKTKRNMILEHFEEIELMQYTGLKDRNGKEIYEGDIIKLRANHGIGIVKYYDEWGAFIVEYIEPKPIVVLGLNYDKDDIKVIGNIWKNKELLD